MSIKDTILLTFLMALYAFLMLIAFMQSEPVYDQLFGDPENIENQHEQPDSIQRSCTLNGKPYTLED